MGFVHSTQPPNVYFAPVHSPRPIQTPLPTRNEGHLEKEQVANVCSTRLEPSGVCDHSKIQDLRPLVKSRPALPVARIQARDLTHRPPRLSSARSPTQTTEAHAQALETWGFGR